jgi:hypothetical protein
MAGRTKPLVMAIDGDVSGLQTAARAATRVSNDIADTIKAGEADVRASAAMYAAEFEKIANVSQTAMRQAADGISKDIARMVREAERASKLGQEFNPAGGFTSQGQQLLADNSRKLAVQLEQQAAAYERVAAAGGPLAVTMRSAAGEATLHAKALQLEANAAELVADELRKVEVATVNSGNAQELAGKKITGASGQMRAGMQQLSFQVGDVATQFSMGTPPMTIFAQQSGQVVQSLQLMSGETKGLLGVIGGPWGIVITAGVTILGSLAAKLIETGDATEELTEELKKNAAETEATREAKERFKTTEDGVRQAILDQRAALNEQIEGLKSQAQLAYEAAKANLAHEISIRNVTKAQIAAAIERNKEFQGSLASTDPRLASQFKVSQADIDGLKERLAEQDKLIAAAQQNLLQTESQYSIEQGKRLADPIEVIKSKYDGPNGLIEKARQRAVAEGKVGEALQRQVTLMEQARAKEIERARPGRGSAAPSVAEQASVGDMTALLQQLLPGVRITSTTGDRHVKGSDHYAGRAIDFVPAGGMGQFSYDEMLQMLRDAGVDIRRNSGGKLQFFGPGHGPKGPGDRSHDDHFHVAWQGKASPESAQRIAERQAEEAQRNRQALDSAMLASKQDQARLAREGVTDATELARIDKETIDAGLARKLAQNAKLKLDHAELDALDTANAETEKRAVDEKLRRELADKAYQQESARIDAAAELLQLEGDLATSLKERKKIAQRLLDLWRKQAEMAAAHQYDQDGNAANYAAAMLQIGQAYGLKQRSLDRDTQSPIADYRDQLKRSIEDTNEALDGVKVHALQNLEDGLLGLIDGTESVASAFKKMTASIIADLARIAIEKAILKVLPNLFHFAEGDVPGNATGHVPGFASGIISGPGTGTSDSIMAWHEALGPIRVSNGESIITAAGTRKHRRLLKAINDDTLPSFGPGFASGMIANAAYPSLPSGSSLRTSPGMNRGTFGGDGETIVRIQLDSDMLQGQIIQGAGRVVLETAPAIIGRAKSETIRDLSRPSLG